jgi:sec-independent protein translocase protein TatB
MFDLGWLEFAIVGLVMILVLGPKELPHAMRSIARFMRKARRLASEFQGHMDDIIREADLDDVKQTMKSIKNQNVNALISDTVDPTGELKKEIDGTIEDARREMGDIKSTAGVSPTASGSSVPVSVNPTPTDTPAASDAVTNKDTTEAVKPVSQSSSATTSASSSAVSNA